MQKKTQTNKTSNYHLTIGTLHEGTLFYRNIYVFINKHNIAPVKINVIFMYRCTGKPLNLQLAASHRNFFYQTQKFILNKNGDTE